VKRDLWKKEKRHKGMRKREKINKRKELSKREKRHKGDGETKERET
jgi:hypothetical protein